jgi:glycosyltransferase involved in cell wall biosynthesis
VLVAGKLQPWKRPGDVLEAMQNSDLAVNVIVVGDGPLRRSLELRYGKDRRIRFLGFVNQVEMAKWYGVADIYALTSDSEPWGLGVNEAMAAGAIPVVTEAVGCQVDLVTRQTGRVVSVGDVAGIRASIGEIVASPKLRDSMRSAGQDVIERYSVQEASRGIAAGIAQCLMA